MAIKVKAVERNVAFEKGAEKWAYVLQADLYNKLTQAKVIQEASLRSGISKGAINAAWDAIGEVIKAWATEGHAVAVPGLGSMRFGIRSTSVANVNKVGADLITARRVIFTPSVEIKDELRKTSINITCYDRNGEIVKRVTSTDDSDVEDPDNEDDNNPDGGGNGGGQQTNTGGGSTNTGGGSTTDNSNTDSGDNTDTPQTYTVTVTSSDPEQGSVSGGGQYAPGKRASVSAEPNEGYEFERWSDGNTSVSRSFAVNQDTDLIAYFKAVEASGEEENP